MVGVALASLVWVFIADHVTGLAMGIAPNIAADDFMHIFESFRMRQRISAAIKAACDQFTKELRQESPELLAALDRAGFEADKRVAAILGQVAVNPQNEHTQARQLAEVMRQASPTTPTGRLEHAAWLLIQALHQQISAIPELREGLILLETLQVRRRLENPEYAPGLLKSILKTADKVQRELRHGYISTGHLLDAIVVEPRSVAAWILGQLDVTPKNVRASLQVIKSKTGLPPEATSDGARAALKDAPELAREYGALLTGTEHVLLALAKQVIDEGPYGKTIRAIFGWLDVKPQVVYDKAVEVARGQSALQSAILSFSGADHGPNAPAPGAPNAGPEVVPPDALTSMETLGR